MSESRRRIRRGSRLPRRSKAPVNRESFLQDLRKGSVLAAVLLVVALGIGQLMGSRFLLRPERFVVETDGGLERERILALSGLTSGKHRLWENLHASEERLNGAPVVKRARIKRVFPNAVQIRIEERFPVANLVCPEMGIGSGPLQMKLVMDSEGVPLQVDSLSREPGDLPRFEILPVNGLRIGHPTPGAPALASAAQVLARWEEAVGSQTGPPRTIRQVKPYSIEVTTADDVAVTFGFRDLEGQFRNLQWILRHSKSEERILASINLVPTRNIPVTYKRGTGTGDWDATSLRAVRGMPGD